MFQVAATRLYAPIAINYGRTFQFRMMTNKVANKAKSSGGVLGWGEKKSVCVSSYNRNRKDVLVRSRCSKDSGRKRMGKD